jgi:hypothetical protein
LPNVRFAPEPDVPEKSPFDPQRTWAGVPLIRLLALKNDEAQCERVIHGQSLLSRDKLEPTAIADRALRHTFVFGPGFKRHSHFFGAHESPTDISILRAGIERN